MKLRYLYLGFDNLNERYYSDKKRFAYNFTSNYRFIANYLSKTIRKYKIENNIGVNMLYIRLTPEDSHIKVKEYSHVLEVFLHFTKEDLDKILQMQSHEERFEAYLELYERSYAYTKEQGFEIGQDILLILHRNFRELGYKNEWLWKKKLFREHDMYVFFKCAFTTIDFTLTIEVMNAKKDILRLKQVLFRTYPDELCYDKDFRHIIIDGSSLIITDFLNHPFIGINIDDLKNNILTVDGYGHDLLHKYEKEIKLIEW